MVRPHMLGRALRFLGFYLVLSLVIAPLLLLQLLPWYPRSVRGWLILFVVAVPVVLLGELVGDFLLKNRISAAVDRSTRATSLSWLRIGYVLGVLILCFAAVVLVLHVLRRLVL
jgi:hypothetical protein